MLTKTEFRSVTGTQKAAMLMLSLGEEHAMRIFTMMDEDEIKELSQSMANLGTVDADMVERLFVEFAEKISATGSLLGTYESTERLLSKALPADQVEQIMEEIRGPAGRTMWDKLGNVNEEVLANYLKNEYPQTVAVVLSKIRPEHAARVLAMLPEEFAMEVVMRMLRMEVVQKDILDGVEKTLRTEFMTNLARTNRRDPHEMMAEIFNNLDRNNESRFLTALEDRNRDVGRADQGADVHLRGPGEARPVGVQTLLRTVDKDKLAVALKGASEQLQGPVLLQHVRARRQDPARGHGGDGPGPAARRRRGADAHGRVGQGPRRARRDHHRRHQGRRRAGLLTMVARPQVPVRHPVRPEAARGRAARRRRRAPTFSEAELAAARAAGRGRGTRQAGSPRPRAPTRAGPPRRWRRSPPPSPALAPPRKRRWTTRGGPPWRLAAAIARKIAPELARRGADEAIATLFAERLSDLLDEPRLVIRLDAARIDAVKDRLEAIAAQSGYAGKLIFLAADGLDAPDCRIEWADGGVERLMARVTGEIDRIVAQYLDSPSATPPRPHPNPPRC